MDLKRPTLLEVCVKDAPFFSLQSSITHLASRWESFLGIFLFLMFLVEREAPFFASASSVALNTSMCVPRDPPEPRQLSTLPGIVRVREEGEEVTVCWWEEWWLYLRVQDPKLVH